MKSIMDASVSNLYEEGYIQRSRRPYNINRVCPALPGRVVLSLGITQILVGVVCLSIQVTAIVVDMDGYYIALGLSFGFPYLLAGSLGCAAAHKKTIRLINGFRRFSLGSASFSGILLVAYSLFFSALVMPKYCNASKPYKCRYKINGFALIVVSMVVAIVSGILSAVICKKAAEVGPRYSNGSGHTQLLHIEDQDRRAPYSRVITIPQTSMTRNERSNSCVSPPRLEPRPATVPFTRTRSGSEPPVYRDIYPAIHRSLINDD